MERRPVDAPTLVAGVAVLLLGLVLLGDQAGVLHLRFDWLAPALLGAVGAILLASGLAGRR